MFLGCWNYTCTLFACWESYVWLSTFATPDLQGYTYEMIGFHIQIMILQPQTNTLDLSLCGMLVNEWRFKHQSFVWWLCSSPAFWPTKIGKGQMWDIIFPKQKLRVWKKNHPQIFLKTLSQYYLIMARIWEIVPFSFFFLLKLLVPKKVYRTSIGWVGTIFQTGIWYCWWKKSCTSWYGKYPIIYVVLYFQGGAGRC